MWPRLWPRSAKRAEARKGLRSDAQPRDERCPRHFALCPDGHTRPGPSASPAASAALVSDLDLAVKAPNGTYHYPNGLYAADRRNNVEGLVLAPPVPGEYLVQVSGFNVPMGPQPYALVAHGNVTGMVTASLPFRLPPPRRSRLRRRLVGRCPGRYNSLAPENGEQL